MFVNVREKKGFRHRKTGNRSSRQEIYDYYVTRVKNPLKRRQAMMAVSCKLIRVFHAILTKGMDYDRFKMMKDIHRNSELIAA